MAEATPVRLPARTDRDRTIATRAAGEAMVLRALDVISDHGGDREAVLMAAGIRQHPDDLRAGGVARLSSGELQSLAGRANVVMSNLDADRAGRARFRDGDYRLLFYCLAGDHSLRQAIERAEVVFAAVDGRLGSLELVVERDSARLRFGRRRGIRDALGFAVALHGLCNYHNILEWLIGGALPAIADFDFPAEFAVTIEPALLPFTLRMDRAEQSLCFAASYLDHPVIRSVHDSELMPSLNFLFEVPSRTTGLDAAARARRSLARRLREDGRLCSLGELADMLQLSAVALRRRLANAGTSFRDLRDSVRRELALELLLRTSLPIEAVSDRLDFCDSDAFRRAMHAWTGQSPTLYRSSRKEPAFV